MSKLRHAKILAAERKDPVYENKIDQQIVKLKALEKLQKEEVVAWEQLKQTHDFEGAVKLSEQVEHAQAEYDAQYESFMVEDTKWVIAERGAGCGAGQRVPQMLDLLNSYNTQV